MAGCFVIAMIVDPFLFSDWLCVPFLTGKYGLLVLTSFVCLLLRHIEVSIPAGLSLSRESRFRSAQFEISTCRSYSHRQAGSTLVNQTGIGHCLNAIAEKLKRQSKDDFKGRHFEARLIVQAVTWYLR
jgi:hypothetical protein